MKFLAVGGLSDSWDIRVEQQEKTFGGNVLPIPFVELDPRLSGLLYHFPNIISVER